MTSQNTAPLAASILKSAKQYTDPAKRNLSVLEDQCAIALSRQFGCYLRQIYIVALKNNVWPYRYVRNRDILSRNEQLKLAESRVAVIGSGGLGGMVILLLARMGIGHLTIVDPDVFDETNLNRQAVSTMSGLGSFKADEAVRMVGDINPAVDAQAHRLRLTPQTTGRIIHQAEAVVDALDNVPDRLALEKATKQHQIPLVHAAIAGFDGQMMTIFPEDPGLQRVYGDWDPKTESQMPEAVLGVPAVTPTLMATLQAMEVLKVLLKRGDCLRNRLLHVNLEHNRFEVFQL